MLHHNSTKLHNLFFLPVKEFLLINETAQKALSRLGISNMRDLVFYKPVSYNLIKIWPDLGSCKTGDLVQVEVVLDGFLSGFSTRPPLKMRVSNDTGYIILVFFNQIHPYIYSKFRSGQKYIIAGKIEIFDNSLQIIHPEFIFRETANSSIIPVYPLTYGIVNKQLYYYICDGIKMLEENLDSIFTLDTSLELGMQEHDILSQKKYLSELLEEIKELHFVSRLDENNVLRCEMQSQAIEKLATKELFSNQASLAKIRLEERRPRGRSFVSYLASSTARSRKKMDPTKLGDDIASKILAKLGFKLTSAQRQAIKEIQQDQASPMQMMRLLQGDVGSGKTLVALLTMINVVKCGAQSTLMVPTDLLSAQHYQFFSEALEDTGIKVALLTGKTPAKQKKQLQADLLSGQINILIGTHALFQDGVEFKDLGYIIIDEQHKFGVEQRLGLIKKASHPDVLVMTATPIPRSLTLTMFGDMDVSQLKKKPRNRLPIITTIISNQKKLNVIDSLEKKIKDGEKIYWVCPKVDESQVEGKSLRKSVRDSQILEDSSKGPSSNVKCSDVTTRFAELNKAYPGQVAMIHGKLKGNLKDQIMQDFKEGATKILVATTVIEVGIDVSDSSLIIIENAENFGLAQLHQLRGRVGRGGRQSHCVLMYNPKRLSEIAKQRLKTMRDSNDGFYIAEQDLILRGGGEILGTKQSGEPEFFFADLARDLKLLLNANQLVKDMQHALLPAKAAGQELSESGVSGLKPLGQNIPNNEFIDFQIELFARNKRELVKTG